MTHNTNEASFAYRVCGGRKGEVGLVRKGTKAIGAQTKVRKGRKGEVGLMLHWYAHTGCAEEEKEKLTSPGFALTSRPLNLPKPSPDMEASALSCPKTLLELPAGVFTSKRGVKPAGKSASIQTARYNGM